MRQTWREERWERQTILLSLSQLNRCTLHESCCTLYGLIKRLFLYGPPGQTDRLIAAAAPAAAAAREMIELSFSDYLKDSLPISGPNSHYSSHSISLSYSLSSALPLLYTHDLGSGSTALKTESQKKLSLNSTLASNLTTKMRAPCQVRMRQISISSIQSISCYLMP